MSNAAAIQVVYYPAVVPGPAPPPMAPILEPLPKERRIQKRLGQEEEHRERKAAIKTKSSMRRGVLGSLVSLSEEIGQAVSSGFASGTGTVMDRYQVRDCPGSGGRCSDHPAECAPRAHLQFHQLTRALVRAGT